MLYTTLTVHGEEYKLRLGARQLVDLERKFGSNPLSILGDLGKCDTEQDVMACLSIDKFVSILHASLQRYHHGITMDDVFNIYDDMLAEGFDIGKQLVLLSELFQNCGLIPKVEDEEDSERKN